MSAFHIGLESDYKKGRKIMDDFNWVENRNSCTADKMYHLLRAGVESDVRTRNEQRKAEDFTIYSSTDGSFSVRKQALMGGVTFSVSDGKISATEESTIDRIDYKHLIIEASVSMSDDGVCRLWYENEHHELWQFRRRALELHFSFN